MNADEGSGIHILYVGHLTPGGTYLQRQWAFEDLRCRLTLIDLASPTGVTREPRLWERVRRKLLGPRDWTGANKQISEWAGRDRFDALWIDRGLQIAATTLRDVKAAQPDCRMIGYSPDDMHARHIQSPRFRRHLHLYDIFFTTKSYGAAELKAMACQDVAFLDNAVLPGASRAAAPDRSCRARALCSRRLAITSGWQRSSIQLTSTGGAPRPKGRFRARALKVSRSLRTRVTEHATHTSRPTPT
jgi:hypothetical protein